MCEHDDRLQQIEERASLLSDHSGWETREPYEREHMAFGLADKDVPWLLEQIRNLREKNERQLERIRDLGFKREEAVKALEWALDEIGEPGLNDAGNRKGEWVLRVLATLKGRPA